MIKIPALPSLGRTTRSDRADEARSDQVRQRRQQRMTTGASRVNRRTVSTVYQPPITQREVRFGQPVANRARYQPRRQYAISFGASGGEMVLPAFPSLRLGWRAVSLLVCLVLGALILFVWNSEYFRVAGIKTDGLTRLKPADIEALIGIKGEPVVTINPQELEKLISVKFPELTGVKVKVDFPAKVQLSARERQPVVAWKTKDRTLWVDSAGYIFPARGDAGQMLMIESNAEPPQIPPVKSSANLGAANKPAVPVEAAPRQMDAVILKAAMKLSSIIPDDTTIIYSNQNGFGWSDKRGWNAYLGTDLENITEKMVVYQSITTQLEKSGVKPGMVSVEQIHAPYYRMER